MRLPAGFRLVADRDARRYDDGRVLIGGAPRRVLRLTDRGAQVAERLLAGEPLDGNGDSALARRLLDSGIAHPLPPRSLVSVEVVVPVFEGAGDLDRCLAALGSDLPVTVVDDGSGAGEEIARVAARHGARLVRLPDNRGPATARNAGAAGRTADVIAFVDSDAVTAAATLRALADHFADPAVAAVAPRVRPLGTPTGWLGAFADAWSPLDLGPRAARVAPAGRVAYVPSTVLLVRRAALDAAGGFDPQLRYGEDVDLVWRLAETGAHVRYEPDVVVHHREPRTWPRWLSRRFAYGTSVGDLVTRHGERTAPLVVQPAPAATVALAVAGRPAAGAAVAAVTAWRLRRRLRDANVPAAEATRGALAAPPQTALGAARWASQLWWPALMLVAARSRRARPAVLATLVAPPLTEWVLRRPDLDPVRWTVAVLADDAAYGLGVWRGSLRARTPRPLFPRMPRARSVARYAADIRR